MDMLFDGPEEMAVVGAGVKKKFTNISTTNIKGGGFHFNKPSSPSKKTAEEADIAGMNHQLTVYGRSASNSPTSLRNSRNDLGMSSGLATANSNADSKAQLDEKMASMEQDLQKLRVELRSLAEKNGTDKDALMAEYGGRLRASYDSVLSQLEIEYEGRKESAKQKLYDQPASSAGFGKGRSAGNQAHRFRLPPDAATVDAQDEMLFLLKRCFQRQASTPGGLEKDIFATDETVNVANLCLAMEVDPALKPWLGRLARLDCYTDETLTLQEVLLSMRNGHPRSRISYTEFREYFTRGGSQAGVVGAADASQSPTKDAAGGAGGAGKATAKSKSSSLRASTENNTTPNLKRSKATGSTTASSSKPPGGNKQTAAKKPTTPSTAKASNKASSTFASKPADLKASLDAKTKAALELQKDISAFPGKAAPVFTEVRAEDAGASTSNGTTSKKKPSHTFALIGLRVLLEQEYGDLDSVYRKLDQEGTGFVSLSEFTLELRTRTDRFEPGFADGSIETVIDALRNENAQMDISELLGIPVPKWSNAAERVDGRTQVVPKDEAFSAFTFGQTGPGGEEGAKLELPAQKFQNFIDDVAAGSQSTGEKMGAMHWQALEDLFKSIDTKKVDVQRFLYKVRDSSDSPFVQNNWLSLIVADTRDPVTAEARGVTLAQCLEYLEDLKVYESQPFYFFQKRLEEAPSKRYPKLGEYVPVDAEKEVGNQWLVKNYKVDAKILRRVCDVFTSCQSTKPEFPVRKAEFIMQLKQKASLLADLHKTPVMMVEGGGEKSSLSPLWAEIIPGLAGYSKDMLQWSDVLEVVKARCDVYKAITDGKQAAKDAPGESATKKSPPSKKKMKYEPIVVTTAEDDDLPAAAKELQAMVQSIERGDQDGRFASTSPEKGGPGSPAPFVAPIVTQPGDEYSPNKKGRSLSPIPPAESFDLVRRTQDFSLVKGPELADMIDNTLDVEDPATEAQNRALMPVGKLQLVLDADYSAFLQASQPETRLEAVRRRVCTVLELDPTCVSLKSLSRKNGLLQLDLETEQVSPDSADKRLGFATQGSFDLNGVIGYRVVDLRFQGRVFIEDGEKIYLRPNVATFGSTGDSIAPAAGQTQFPAGRGNKTLSKEELTEEERKYADWSSSRNVLEKHGEKYASTPSLIKMPSFAAPDNYWELRQGTRIRDRRLNTMISERDKEQTGSTKFVANPVPQHIYLPRYSQLDLAEKARRSSAKNLARLNYTNETTGEQKNNATTERPATTRGRSLSRGGERDISSSETKRMRSQSADAGKNAAQPVLTWDTVNKNYQESSKYQLYKANRSASVPPKYDKVYQALYADKLADDEEKVQKPFVANGFKCGKPLPQKQEEPEWPLKVKEVPNFRQIHVRNQRQFVEKKQAYKQALGVTAGKAFNFTAKKRLIRAPPVDETDLRWQKATGTVKKPRGQSSFSRPNLIESEKPNVMPPKTTAKTLQQRQHTAQRIRERQQREDERKRELESYLPSEDTKERVQATLNKEKSTQAMELERRTYEFRMGQIATEKRWKKQLKEIKEKLNNRPLLMERTQMEQARERARQRALLRVKATMEQKGVKNVDAHFKIEELNMMEGL
ncbi:unnamed protein product [Amoebophrya sp. A120]|nr:unnamed protein product [Amoebophrya sp. A120]|eukprot:GSA120T00024038001.1